MNTTTAFTEHEEPREGYFFPEGCALDRWIALLLFISSCLYLRLFYDYTLLNADEGIVLQGAQRIIEGQVLYRDFFSFYTPGSYYWMALLFRIFGSSLLVGRAALVIYGGVFSVLTYLLARRICARWSALLTVYMVLLTCLPFRFVALHNWDSTLLAYLALYCAVVFLERGHWTWMLGTGSFAALTCLFEQSKGTGLVLGLLLGGFVLVHCNGLRFPIGYQHQAALFAGFAWPFILTLTYFATQHSLIPMLNGWAWPLFHYTGANKLLYGYLVLSTSTRELFFGGSWSSRAGMLFLMGPCFLLPFLPILAIGILAWSIGKSWRGKLHREKGAYWLLVSSVVTGLLLSTFMTKRPDFPHLDYQGPLFYLPFAWSLDGLHIPSRLWRSLMPVVVFVVFFSYTAFGMVLLWETLGVQQTVRTVRGTVRMHKPDGALQYIQAHVPRGEKIIVYPYGPLHYYLSGTFSATRYDFLQPGMHTSDQMQKAIQDLRTNHPRVALLEISFAEKASLAWPSTPLRVFAERDPVEGYLFSNYRPCAALTANGFWHFVFMVRKDTVCPQEETKSNSR
jgi:hypothetical protein